MKKNVEEGVALYTKEKDGCLLGLFSNEHAKGEIFNEIAKRVGELDADGIGGDYNCFYFDFKGSEKRCELSIGRDARDNTVYNLTWMEGDEVLFRGKGYLLKENTLCVHYWSVE